METGTRAPCPNCQALNASGALTCWNCSSTLGGFTGSHSTTPLASQASTALFRELTSTRTTHGVVGAAPPRKRRPWIGALVSFVVLAGLVTGAGWWFSGRPVVSMPGSIGKSVLLTDAADQNDADTMTNANAAVFPGSTVTTGIYGTSPKHRTIVISTFENTGVDSIDRFLARFPPLAGVHWRKTTVGDTTVWCHAVLTTGFTDTCVFQRSSILGTVALRATDPADADADARADIATVVRTWREKLLSI